MALHKSRFGLTRFYLFQRQFICLANYPPSYLSRGQLAVDRGCIASLDTASALTSSFPSLAAFMAGIAHGDIGRRR
jgi:hypothetical protein